jgi:VWFA-related protein
VPFVRLAVAAVLLLSALILSWGQSGSSDYPYVLRLEHVTEGEDVCVLLQRDGHYHFERVLSEKAAVYEGTISSASLQEVQTAISNDELLNLTQGKISAHLVAPRRDELDVRVARVTQWQLLRFPDQESRKFFHQSLDPLLKWLDGLPAQNRTRISEDEGKNNCLPPRSEDVRLTGREETSVPASVKAAPFLPTSYMLRILMDQVGPGEAKRTCAIVYPNGFYHLEKSRQKYDAEGVYQLDTVYQGLGGKIKADVFEQVLDSSATEELRKLLDNPDLIASRHSNLPTGHYSDADISFVFIPRNDSLQRLTFATYFGVDNLQTIISAGGAGTRHVDSAADLVSPLQKWLKSNIESRKAARLKDTYGDNCTPVSTQILPSQISNELAQVVPSDLDSGSAEGGKPIPTEERPAESSTAQSPTAAKDFDEHAVSANEPAISLRVTTRMVLLDVVATDKNGKPIADLQPADIEVLEDGREQKVKLFSRASSETASDGKRSPPGLPANVYSNRPEYRQAAGPLVLLLLDGVNTASDDQVYARRQMLDYLRTLKLNQRVAILALTSDLLLLQDFTSDPQVLISALEKYSSNDSLLLARGAPATITPQMAEALAAAPDMLRQLIRFNQENAVNANDERVHLTLAALRAVARAMIGYPGRKNLIWVSSGFPVSIQLGNRNSDLSRSYAADLTSTAALLSQAQVAVYPVDARGLISNLQERPNTFHDPLDASEIVPTVQTSDQPTFGADELTRIAPLVVDSHFAMEQVARDTGGRAFYNANDLATAVATGVKDGGSYYTVGYYPENKNWDGKFRKITLKAERKDLRLRYRPGYYAFDSTVPTGPPDNRREQNRLAELLRASKDPLPATGVTFWAHLIPPRNGDASAYVEFLVDANTISFAETGARHDCNVDFAAFTVAPNGNLTNTVVKNVDTALPASQYAAVRKRGLPFRMQINLQRKDGELRLAVRDNRTGLLGTLTIPIRPNSLQAGVKQ